MLFAESEGGCVLACANTGAVVRCHNPACNNGEVSSTGTGRDRQHFHCNKQQTCGLWKGLEAQTHLLIYLRYHHCEDTAVAYSHLCWLRTHRCYWKDLWRKQFASFPHAFTGMKRTQESCIIQHKMGRTI